LFAVGGHGYHSTESITRGNQQRLFEKASHLEGEAKGKLS
jgi:hypothetical protein